MVFDKSERGFRGFLEMKTKDRMATKKHIGHKMKPTGKEQSLF
jgi:hypothetical protein